MNLLESFQKVLILASHTDDAEFGCGGTIAKLIHVANDVHYVAFSLVDDSVPKEFPSDILRKEVMPATTKLGLR